MDAFYQEEGTRFNRKLLGDNVRRYGIFLPGEIPNLPIVSKPQGEIALMRMPSYDVIPEDDPNQPRKIKSVIHSNDTLHELYYWLQNLSKKGFLEYLLIEGRVLTNQQWYALGDDPIWKFMGFSGKKRARQDELTDVLTFILPRDCSLSQKQILDLCEMRFGPSQSAEAIGADSAFFPADLLLEVCEINNAGGSLLKALLDGCNEFHIAWTGPRTVFGSSARSLANEFAIRWKKKEGYVSRNNVSTALTDETIIKVAEIQHIRIKRSLF